MKTIKIIMVLFSFVLTFIACVKEKFPGLEDIVEGESTLISLQVDVAKMDNDLRTKAMTAEQETKIENLRVMVFNSRGEIITNKKFTDRFSLAFHIDSYSGSNSKIYVVANVVDAVDKRLFAASTLDQVKATLATDIELGYGLNEAKPLMMIGSVEKVDIPSGSYRLPKAIQLHFLAAKLTLIVKDATPAGQQVILLGWDVVNAPRNIYVFPNDKDACSLMDDKLWLTTTGRYPFETIDVANKSVKQELYLLENRRQGRVDRALPTEVSKIYTGMDVKDRNDKGKAWFAPTRATAVVIYAMHKTSTATKQIKAYIYIGSDNHSNYDVERGNHYTFTITVKGLNDIYVDSNVGYTDGYFNVDYGTNLDMDSHPDYRPMRIQAPQGIATMEIIDDNGRTYKDPGFTATWLKISPLNLEYHQVRQNAPNDTWQQQAGLTGSFVRGKYIPHKSVRAILALKGGWNRVPVGKEEDDEMTFADATYRMCYKIIDIPFIESVAVTNKTLCVYADEFLNNGGSRSAKVRFTFVKQGGDASTREIREFPITQSGYLAIYDESKSTAGLAVLNEDGTPSNSKKRFVIEQYEEAGMVMNPGVDPAAQMTTNMQWGFLNVVSYNKPDKYRNGYFITANGVYTDVTRINNEPTGFGVKTDSYRPMYGNGITGGNGEIVAYGKNTFAPYYYPLLRENIYHPIYKSSAARYCHEKNRDINGDGFIDASETKWYLPSQHELQMIYIANILPFASYYWSATEFSVSNSWAMNFGDGDTSPHLKVYFNKVRCVRVL